MSGIRKDSGWSWLVCFGSGIALLLETGMIKALGVTLPSLQEQFVTDTWVIGLVISLVPGLGAISCLFGGVFLKATSPRIAMMTYGLLSSIGLIAGSWAAAIPMLILAVLLIGCSLGAEAITLAALPLYFDEYYDLANGIAHAGISVGLMILPPATQLLLDTYGWRGTFLILGGLNLHLVVAGVLLRPLQTPEKLFSTDKTNAVDALHQSFSIESPDSDLEEAPVELFSADKTADIPYQSSESSDRDLLSRTNKSFIAYCLDYIDLDLFLNFDFVTLLCVFGATGYFFTGWMIYFVPHLLVYGFGTTEASFLATMGGVGNLLGTIAFPITAKRCSGKILLYLSVVITGVAIAMDPLMSTMRSYLGIMVSSFMVNFGFQLIDCAIFKEVVIVVEEKKLPIAVNWLFVIYSIGSVCSGFLSGWLFDNLGDYTASFLFLSATILLSVSPWVLRDIRNALKGSQQYEPIRPINEK